MIYYHGTDKYFDKFILGKSRTYMDFGAGIYLSERLSHAEQVALWKNGSSAYVYTYKVNLAEIRKKFSVKEFRTPSIEWLKFVIKNRTDLVPTDYDIIIGPTADSNAQTLIQKFIRVYKNPSDSDYKRLQAALKTSVYPCQICIKTERALELFNNSRTKEVRYR